MSRAFVLLICFAAPLLSEWHQFTSEECALSGEFPAHVNTRAIPIHGAGPHRAYYAYPDRDTREIRYEVYCQEQGIDVSKAPDLEGFLDRLAPGSEKTTFLGHSARSRYEVRSDIVLREITFAAGRQAYTLSARDSVSARPRMDRFFNGFALTNQ